MVCISPKQFIVKNGSFLDKCIEFTLIRILAPLHVAIFTRQVKGHVVAVHRTGSFCHAFERLFLFLTEDYDLQRTL